MGSWVRRTFPVIVLGIGLALLVFMASCDGRPVRIDSKLSVESDALQFEPTLVGHQSTLPLTLINGSLRLRRSIWSSTRGSPAAKRARSTCARRAPHEGHHARDLHENARSRRRKR